MDGAGRERDSPSAPWKRFVDRNDAVTSLAIRGDDAFLVSRKNAPTSQVLQVKAGAPLSTATVLVAAHADRVIEDVRAASDGLYVLARRGVYSTLLRVPTGSVRVEEFTAGKRSHRGSFHRSEQARDRHQFLELGAPAAGIRLRPATGKFATLGLEVQGHEIRPNSPSATAKPKRTMAP